MFNKEIKLCSDCKDPTKTPVGFWDGRDAKGRSTSGFLFSCENIECPIKQEEIRIEQEEDDRYKKIKEENSINNIDIKKLKNLRRKAFITIKSCSDLIGISPPLYCDYEYERKPMPLDKYNDLIKYLGGLQP